MASPPGYTTPAKEKAPRRGASKELLGSSKYLLSTKTSTSWPTKESGRNCRTYSGLSYILGWNGRLQCQFLNMSASNASVGSRLWFEEASALPAPAVKART